MAISDGDSRCQQLRRARIAEPRPDGGSAQGSRPFHTSGVNKYLTAAQVSELAELLEDAPERVGVIDQVLQAAAEGRGMTLRLVEPARAQGRQLAAGKATARGESDLRPRQHC